MLFRMRILVSFRLVLDLLSVDLLTKSIFLFYLNLYDKGSGTFYLPVVVRTLWCSSGDRGQGELMEFCYFFNCGTSFICS